MKSLKTASAMEVQLGIRTHNVGWASYNEKCMVEKFMKEKFKSLPLNEKWTVVKNFRPSPVFKLLAKTGETYFHKEYYEKVDLLCGCEHTSRVYCWPCILFPADKNEWNTSGIGDVNDFYRLTKKHELTQPHLVSAARFKKVVAYHLLKRFVAPYATKYRWTRDAIPTTETVNQVTANRYVLSKLINRILCTNEQMSFAAIRTVNVSGELDAFLRTLFGDSPALTELWCDVRIDLLDAVNRAVLEEIKNEVRTAKFVSVTVDEIVDANCRVRFSTVIRYTDKSKTARARFVGFTDPGPNRSADVISQHIIEIAKEFECEHKLVAHAYDGGSVSTAEHSDVQSRIRAVCSDSVYCYNHGWTLILSQGVRHIAECKEFFDNLMQFSAFFERSPTRREVFRDEIERSSPTAGAVVWDHVGNVLNAVSDYRRQMITAFVRITGDETRRDYDAAADVEELVQHLNNFEFNFMVHLFAPIFKSAGLYDAIFGMAYDTLHCAEELRFHLEYLECMKDDYEIFWSELKEKYLDGNDGEYDYESYEKFYRTVIDTCIAIVKDSSHYTDDLLFLRLFDFDMFPGYRSAVPEILMKSLEAAYGDHFDIVKLKTQLAVMYASPAFELNCIHCIKELILRRGLTTQWDQLLNLIDLVCCIPIVNPPFEWNFGIINRIRAYAKSNLDGENMCSFAIATLEKELVNELLINNSFYDSIFEEFSKRDTRSRLNH